MADHKMVMMARLRAALSASDKQTQQFLQPLLSLRGVQDLLLTFVQDASRSFEDWVWDPPVRQTLLQLQQQHEQQGPHDEAVSNPHELDRVYARALHERLAEATLADHENETPRAFLEAATAAQDEGKQKFHARFYYAARNAFLKSLDAVEKHQVSEYYGHSVPPSKWDDDEIQAWYVQLCTNVAICSIKLKDLALIQEYATKALSVDETSTKALYALAKGQLMEHRHDEAEKVIEKALGVYPDKAQFLNLRKDVAAARRKWDLNQAEVATLGASQLAAAAAVGDTIHLTALTPEEQELQYEKERQVRVDATRLPSREEGMQLAASRLHVYFMKMKQQMAVEIRPLHNADAGEEPLFECTIANGETGEVLASDVQGPSKKSVKNEASKIALHKLWHDKQEAGKLLPEELAELERFESVKAGSQMLMNEPAVPTEAKQPCGKAGSGNDPPQVPIRITCLERQLQPLQLLNQLTQRGNLLARFDIRDVSPSKDVTEFECKGYLNDEYVGAATAISKKKARAEVARQMLAAAYEQNLIFVYDGSTDNEDEDGTYDGKDLDRDEQGLASDA
uniref:DRBM domain-containing protein n=1 Tax=Peronospora matthiolae TaxID=2874970 RepID=A0AAV1UEE3_9STRA